MNSKTFFVVTFILIVIAILSNMPLRFDSTAEIKLADFPKVIGQWRGADIPLPERDYEILETKNLIMRDYKNSNGDSVYLYIISSGSNRRALHPPEICYTGGGATITEKSVMPLTNSIKANKFIIEDKNSKQLVVYWFKSAGLNTYSYLRQQLKMVADRVFGKGSSGTMIRVSADIGEGSQEVALGLIKAFCVQIEPLLQQYVP